METIIMLILWIAVVIICIVTNITEDKEWELNISLWGKNVQLFIKFFHLWKENKGKQNVR